jgi:hypothetical protein
MTWTPRLEAAEGSELSDYDWYEQESGNATPEVYDEPEMQLQEDAPLQHDVASLYKGFVSMLCGDQCAPRDRQQLASDWHTADAMWDEENEIDTDVVVTM